MIKFARGVPHSARMLTGRPMVIGDKSVRLNRAGLHIIDNGLTGGMSRRMAGKGKYVAGAVAAGLAVGGMSRRTRGADRVRGRSTGVYGF